MKYKIFLNILGCVIASTAMSQEIMYIEYKDGRSVKAEVDNVNNISFHNLDELPADPAIIDVSRGLLAYYTFDNETVNDTQNHYHGFMGKGTFISDTPNGQGKALFLKRGEKVSIPYNPFNELQNHTLNLWIKDFGSGPIFQTYDYYVYAPTLYITEEIKARAYTGSSDYNHYCTFSTDLSTYQSEKWTMISIVTSTGDNKSQGTCKLYVNGILMESSTPYTNRNGGAKSMSIGGYAWAWADPMKIDNVRLYDVALTQEEIIAIYNAERQPTAISVFPSKLYFDKNTNSQTITITNNSLRLIEFAASSSDKNINLSVVNSHISPKSSKTIDISIKDRNSIDSYTIASVTIESDGMYSSLPLEIEKGSNATPVSEDVSRGLQAYYKFDDGTIKDSRNGYDGNIDGGTFITDTPNGKGKALFLKRGEYANIAYAPLDGKRNHTISLWVKDFGAGYLFQCFDNYSYAPSLFVTEEMLLRAYTGSSDYNHYKTFNTSLTGVQSDVWTMISVVTSTNGSESIGEVRLYINGQRVDAGTSYTNRNSNAISMAIGGSNSDPMKIDNVRLYSVALTDTEIMEIYNAERK